MTLVYDLLRSTGSISSDEVMTRPVLEQVGTSGTLCRTCIAPAIDFADIASPPIAKSPIRAPEGIVA